MADAVGKGIQMQPAWQPGSGLPALPGAAGQAIGPDSRGRPIGLYGRPAITLSNRGSGIHGASCALRAAERLHDPFHENDNLDRF